METKLHPGVFLQVGTFYKYYISVVRSFWFYKSFIVFLGGYYNTSRSSLEIQKRRSTLQQEKKELEGEMADLKNELYSIEEKIKEIGAELQKNETKNSKIK